MKTSKESSASGNGANRPGKKSTTVVTTHSPGSRHLQLVNQAATDVRKLARTYKLSNEVVSRVTGASPRTVSYWNAGTPPQRSSAQKIKEVARLFDALADIIKGSAVGKWLQQPNQQFDGSSPLQVIERGEADRIWRMIWQLREGNPG
jgi:hypothetical protein